MRHRAYCVLTPAAEQRYSRDVAILDERGHLHLGEEKRDDRGQWVPYRYQSTGTFVLGPPETQALAAFLAQHLQRDRVAGTLYPEGI